MRRLCVLVGLVCFSLLGVAQQQPVPEGIIIQPAQTPLAIQLGLEKTSYRPGDKLRLTIALNQSSYVYIYNITPDRRVNLLFPNAYQPVNFLSAGTHTIPNQRYSLVISPPTGVECLQVLALAAPLSLEQLIPQGQFSVQNPFPLLSQKPQEFKSKMQELLWGAVSATGWAAAWTCFQIVAPEGRLRVVSDPPGALVSLNGIALGQTPLEVALAPGRYRIVVAKATYETWNQTIELKGNSEITLEATLKPLLVPPSPPVPPTPPIPPPPAPISPLARLKPTLALGLNGGLNTAQIPSVGFDFGFVISPRANLVGLGVSFLMTGEDVPEYENIGIPIDRGPVQTYREGPETEFYGRFSLALLGGLGIDVAGGLAVQKEAHIALPLVSSGLGTLDVVVKPNGYQTEKVYLTGLIGLSLRSENLILSVGVHNRRGWVIGVGMVF